MSSFTITAQEVHYDKSDFVALGKYYHNIRKLFTSTEIFQGLQVFLEALNSPSQNTLLIPCSADVNSAEALNRKRSINLGITERLLTTDRVQAFFFYPIVISLHFLLSVIILHLPQHKLRIQLYISDCIKWQGEEGYEVMGKEPHCNGREKALMAHQQTLLPTSHNWKSDLGCYSLQISLLLWSFKQNMNVKIKW